MRSWDRAAKKTGRSRASSQDLIEHPGEVLAVLGVAEADDPGFTAGQRQRPGQVVEDLGDLEGHRILEPAGPACGIPGRVLARSPGTMDALGEGLEPLEQVRQLLSRGVEGRGLRLADQRSQVQRRLVDEGSSESGAGPSAEERTRGGRAHAVELIEVILQGHLQPEPEQDPQLVLEDLRGDRRLGVIAGDRQRR